MVSGIHQCSSRSKVLAMAACVLKLSECISKQTSKSDIEQSVSSLVDMASNQDDMSSSSLEIVLQTRKDRLSKYRSNNKILTDYLTLGPSTYKEKGKSEIRNIQKRAKTHTWDEKG